MKETPPAVGRQVCLLIALDGLPELSYGAAMAVAPGRYRLGPECGQIVIKTFRDGLAAQAGHDLTIDVTRWSGEFVVNEDKTLAAIEARMDMTSWVVREGTGGLKPLTDADRREIAATARRLLSVDRHREAEFVATRFHQADDESGSMDGTLTLRGISRPLQLRFGQISPGRYRGTGTVVQSAYGIKPYTAFLGALRVRDAVDFEIEVEAPGQPGAPG
jgi:polyisoprenoid-binding protein YceI